MRQAAVAMVVLSVLLVTGCSDKLPLDQVTQRMLITLAKTYLAGSYDDFAEGMADRGWTVPEEPEDWEDWAKDFGFCLRWVAQHGGPPPPPRGVRSLGVDRSPVEAFGGIGR